MWLDKPGPAVHGQCISYNGQIKGNSDNRGSRLLEFLLYCMHMCTHVRIYLCKEI